MQESECKGPRAVGTKVDEEMRKYVDEEAERLGVTRSEYLRLVLEEHSGLNEPSDDEGLTIEDRFDLEDNIVNRLRRFHLKFQVAGALLIAATTALVVKYRE